MSPATGTGMLGLAMRPISGGNSRRRWTSFLVPTEGLTAPMPPIYESHGTHQFLKLVPLVSNSLAAGGIAIIDELDADRRKESPDRPELVISGA